MPTLAELNSATQYGGTDFQNQDWAAIMRAIQGFSPDQYDGGMSYGMGTFTGPSIPGSGGWMMDEYQPGGATQLTRMATNQTGETGNNRRFDTVDIDPKTGLPTQQWQQTNDVSDNGSLFSNIVPLLGATLAGGGLSGMFGTAGDAASTAGWTSGYDLAGGSALPTGVSGAAGAAGADSGWTSGYDLSTGGDLTGATGAATGATGAGTTGATTTGGGSILDGAKSLVNGIPGGFGTVANLVSGALGAGVANNAGNIQADAANNATALQKYIYDQTSQNVAPWLNAGKTSLSSLMSGMDSGKFNPTPYTASANLSTVGGAPNFQTVANAPKLASYGPEAKMQQFGTVGAMQAYKDYVAQNQYQGPGAWDASKFQQDPGYQFQLQQGLDALTNKSSIAGGMNSNNMKGLIGYAQGMANTDYQQAFQNYQTEAGRGLNEYQTNLQDYMQQFQQGQNVTNLNNQLTQQKYQDMMGTTAANNSATQTNNQNAIQVTGLNNQNIVQDLANAESSAGFNNTWGQTGFQDNLQATGFNNNVSQQGFNNANTTTGLNNQNTQQQFSNLAQLSQVGLGAGLQQGQLGAQYANTAGNNMMSGAAATAAGRVGGANALTGGVENAYNTWLQQQWMNQMAGGAGNFTGGAGNYITGGVDGNTWASGYDLIQPL